MVMLLARDGLETRAGAQVMLSSPQEQRLHLQGSASFTGRKRLLSGGRWRDVFK